jgi:glycosyltransferase involved in cell wall biosynthesis
MRLKRSKPSLPAGLTGAPAVSVIGTLPPIRGVSPYTEHLVTALSRTGLSSLEFVGFKAIYPRWAFPGGSTIERGATAPSLAGVRVRNGLRWYNPFGWALAGLTIRGDVVHAQWWSYALAPVYAVVLGLARLRGKRILITVHNVAPHEGGIVKRYFNRAVLRTGHHFIVHSHQNKEELQHVTGRRGDQIDVLPHGALAVPRTGLTQAEARARLGLPDAPASRVVLCFGHVRAYKGVDVLLRAFAEVARNDADVTLVIAGNPWGSFDHYASLIEDFGLAHRVRLFLDYVATPEIEAFFEAADAVVLPYTGFQAQSGVGALALHFGRALIVSDVGGLPDLVRQPACVVPPSNAPALASAIARLIRDDALRARAAGDSLALAAVYSWDAIAVDTVSLYRWLVSPGETRAPAFLRRTLPLDAAPAAEYDEVRVAAEAIGDRR